MLPTMALVVTDDYSDDEGDHDYDDVDNDDGRGYDDKGVYGGDDDDASDVTTSVVMMVTSVDVCLTCMVPLMNGSGSAAAATYTGEYDDMSGAYCANHSIASASGRCARDTDTKE